MNKFKSWESLDNVLEWSRGQQEAWESSRSDKADKAIAHWKEEIKLIEQEIKNRL